MLSVWNSSTTDKALKLNINTTSTLEQPSYATKVTQQLDSLNSKLFLTLQSESTEERRLSPFDAEDLKTTKRHKISLGNINMLAKYSHDITKGVVEEEQPEDLSRPTTSQCSTPPAQQVQALETAPLKVEQTRPGQLKARNIAPIQRAKALSNYLPATGKSGFNQARNVQEANFGHLPMNANQTLASNMTELMRSQAMEPQLSSLGSFQQLMQLQLSLMGQSPDYVQSLYQDLQMLHRLKEECKALEGLKKSLFVNQHKPQPHPAYMRRPTPQMMARGPHPQMNKEMRRPHPMNNPALAMNGFPGKKMIQGNMRASPERAMRAGEAHQALSQFKMSMMQKNVHEGAGSHQELVRSGLIPQSTTVVGIQNNGANKQLNQNKPLFMNNSVKKTGGEPGAKILGQNIKFFGSNKVQINSEGTQTLVL